VKEFWEPILCNCWRCWSCQLLPIFILGIFCEYGIWVKCIPYSVFVNIIGVIFAMQYILAVTSNMWYGGYLVRRIISIIGQYECLLISQLWAPNRRPLTFSVTLEQTEKNVFSPKICGICDSHFVLTISPRASMKNHCLCVWLLWFYRRSSFMIWCLLDFIFMLASRWWAAPGVPGGGDYGCYGVLQSMLGF